MEQRRRRFIEQVLFLLTAALAIVLGSRALFGLFSPLLYGAIIAAALRPLTNALSRHTRLKGTGAAMAAAGIFYLNAALLLVAVTAYLFGRTALLLQQLPTFLTQELLPILDTQTDRITALLSGLSAEMGLGAQTLFDAIAVTLTNWVTAFSTYLGSCISSFAAKLPIYFMGTVFTVALSLFISADYRRITQFLMRQLTPWQRTMVQEARIFGKSCLGKLAKAYFLLFLITWAELGCGLFLLRHTHPVSTGLGIALLDILPLLGSGSILIPWALLSLLRGRAAFGVGLFLLYAVIAVARNLLEPKIVGEQIGLHPVITISVMFAGLRLMGVPGMMLAPIAVLFLQHLHQCGLLRLYR